MLIKFDLDSKDHYKIYSTSDHSSEMLVRLSLVLILGLRTRRRLVLGLPLTRQTKSPSFPLFMFFAFWCISLIFFLSLMVKSSVMLRLTCFSACIGSALSVFFHSWFVKLPLLDPILALPYLFVQCDDGT